jgi:hypothetical protein
MFEPPVPQRYAENGNLLDSGKVPGFAGTGDAVRNKWKRRQQAIANAERPALIPPPPRFGTFNVDIKPSWIDTHHRITGEMQSSGKFLRVHSEPWERVERPLDMPPPGRPRYITK